VLYLVVWSWVLCIT